jgi:beta-lactamase regulating signal transducer with metallopeptidase domain
MGSNARSATSSPSTPAARRIDGYAILIGIWALGALCLLSATLFGHVAAWRMSTIGVEHPDPHVGRRLATLCVQHGVRRPVRLRVGASMRVPATWGFLRPTIVLPPQHVRWSAATLDRVLLHELAHVLRADCWTYLIGELARALHWLNPLAWYAVSKQRGESERACDDLVLVRGSAASEYAADLLELVRSLRPGRPLPRAALAMARPAALADRVRAVLDPELERRVVSRQGVAATAVVALLVCFLTTAVVPVARAQESPAAPAPVVEPASESQPRLIALTPEPSVRSVPGQAPSAWTEPSPAGRQAGPTAEARSTAEVMATVIEPTAPFVLASEAEESSLAESVPQPAAILRAVSRSRSEPAARLGIPGVPAALPQAAQEVCSYDGRGSRSTHIDSDDEEIQIRWETDGCRVDIEIRGQVEFSPDDTRIASMAPDARVEIEERLGGSQRRARLEGTRGGIERSYWVDREEVAWGSDADRWLAQLLPELFRQTTINARPRVRRMLEEGGPDRVFDEAALIHSDHVKRVYLELLMEEADLTEREYARVIEAAAEIDSDHGSSELLLSVIAEAGMRPAFQEPMLHAAERIDSDHQKSRVLQTLLESELSVEQFDAVIEVAATMDSDHNLGMVLETVAREGNMSNAGRASYLQAVRSMDSDHSRSLVIHAFLDVGTLSPDEVTTVLEMTDGIDSDHNRGEVLQRVAAEYDLNGPQLDAYLRSARQLDSDHQVQMTAAAVIDAPSFAAGHFTTVLAMADQVDSDHNRAMILQELVQRRELGPTQVEALLDVAVGIGSDHQLGATLELLIQEETLDSAGVNALLTAAGQIGSSHQRSTVLIAAARRYEMEGTTRERYLDLTDGLSRHDRDRARAAIADTRRR